MKIVLEIVTDRNQDRNQPMEGDGYRIGYARFRKSSASRNGQYTDIINK
jgi:hypothetical protein